jgi:hypothetical protein
MTTSIGSPAPGPLVIENCAIATMDGARHDDSGTEYRTGHIAVAGGRITAVGEGPAPPRPWPRPWPEPRPGP